VSASFQVREQLVRTFERRHFVDEAVEELLPPVADVVTVLLLDTLARDRLDELIPAHADVSVQAPDREHDAVLPKGAVPTQRVLVIRVDERPVDVE